MSIKFKDLLEMDMGELSDFVIENQGVYELVKSDQVNQVDIEVMTNHNKVLNAFNEAKRTGCSLEDCLHDAILTYLEEINKD